MYQTEVDVPRLVVLRFESGLRLVQQRLSAGRVSLNELAVRLVHDEQMVVFVDGLHGLRSGSDAVYAGPGRFATDRFRLTKVRLGTSI